MDNKFVKKLIERFGRLKADRGVWESHWEEIAQYFIPSESEIYSWRTRVGGEEKRIRLYDSTGAHMLELLSSALLSMLVNPHTEFFELGTGDADVDDDEEVVAWLQKLVRLVHTTLVNSNFHTQSDKLFKHTGGFGTGVMFMLPDFEDIIRFETRPVYATYLDTNYKNEVDTLFIPFQLNYRNAVEKFGEEVFDADERVQYAKEPDRKLEFLQVIMPRERRDKRKKSKKNMPWASYYILIEKERMVDEGGFKVKNFATPRWSVAFEEQYGRGPAMKTLPDVRMLQACMKTVLRGAQKVIDPPLLVPDDSTIPPNTVPGGLNSYRAGTEDFIRPLLTNGRPDIGLELLQNIRDRVKEGFYIDQLQLREGPQMTATEVNARTDEFLRLFAPILNRFENEYLQPSVNRTITELSNKKLLPPDMPDVLADKPLTVRFSSQIAKAQRLSETVNISRWLAEVGNIAGLVPGIIDYFDAGGYVKYTSRAMNIPQEIIRKSADVKKMQEAKAAQQEEQQGEQSALNAAEIANKTKE